MDMDGTGDTDASVCVLQRNGEDFGERAMNEDHIGPWPAGSLLPRSDYWPSNSKANLDDRAFALFRAWADTIPTNIQARRHWDHELSMADHAEWRRRVLTYESILRGETV